jgi:hypothetical protein
MLGTMALGVFTVMQFDRRQALRQVEVIPHFIMCDAGEWGRITKSCALQTPQQTAGFSTPPACDSGVHSRL